ncbi:MAG TPA: hypothetical protein VE709_01470 [Pseudonocardiaceae bacterium]|jgi:hypothetical protein|nr:hypothetical protein [Pseudonocardiaceae bacterium]
MQLGVAPPFLLVKPVSGERDYYDLADEDAPWELLDGRLVMSPASDRHERCDRLGPEASYRTERRSGGRIESTVLPGFWIDVDWLWQEPLPSTVRCLRALLG